jgi:hypothetical protein
MYNPFMHRLLIRQGFIFVAILVFGAGVTLLSGVYTNFHVVGNDFWSVLYYGRHMTWAEKESLYNGFYPIGYAFLIGQYPYGYVVQLAYVTNALLTGLLVASVSSTVASVRSIPARLFAILACMTVPILFVNSNTVGPDIGSVTFTAFAIYLLWKDLLADQAENTVISRALLIGVSLGLSALWRSHAMVSAMAILISFFLIAGIRPLRNRLWMVLPFIGIYSLQVVANLFSGHGAFETAQNFNIYKLLYGVDWTSSPSPSEIANFSLLETFRNDPSFVINAYIVPFRVLLLYALPACACILVARSRTIRQYALFSALVIFLYAIPVAFGDSPRAPLIIMVPYISSLAILAIAFVDRVKDSSGSVTWIPGLVSVILAVASAYFISQWVLHDLEVLRVNRNEQKVFLSIEEVMMAHGLNNPIQAYADRYDFYFPSLPPYQARQIGGFAEDWVWGYSQEYPPLANDSWSSFSAACSEQNIRYLILSPNSDFRGEFFEKIYDDEFNPDEFNLVFVRQRAKTRIYQFK